MNMAILYMYPQQVGWLGGKRVDLHTWGSRVNPHEWHGCGQH